MAQKDATFTGTIPEVYERCLGPMFFRPYADDIAARAQAVGAGRILEVAAGTGIATQAVAAASPAAAIEATDLNGAMVNLAAARHHNEKVRWSIADASALPFEAGRFDLVICQFGVMFFPDRQQAFREARRVLTPDGTYLFNVWDSVNRNDVARITSETVEALFPDNPPDFVRRVPHGHGDPEAIESDLRAAGFSRITCDPVEKRSVASARDAAVGICEGTPLKHEIFARNSEPLADVVDAVTGALHRAFGDPIDAAMRAYVFAAR